MFRKQAVISATENLTRKKDELIAALENRVAALENQLAAAEDLIRAQNTQIAALENYVGVLKDLSPEEAKNGLQAMSNQIDEGRRTRRAMGLM